MGRRKSSLSSSNMEATRRYPLNQVRKTLRTNCVVMIRGMVFKATFDNISAISWRSDLLVEETGVHGENHRSVGSHLQTLLHNVSSAHRHEQDSNSQL